MNSSYSKQNTTATSTSEQNSQDGGQANDRQIGGDHYKKQILQHWDLAVYYGWDYIQARAIAYLMRWRDKAGLEDLEKAVHTAQKYLEVETMRKQGTLTLAIFERVVNELKKAGEPHGMCEASLGMNEPMNYGKKEPVEYRFKVNGTVYQFDERYISVSTIRMIAGIKFGQVLLLERPAGWYVTLDDNEVFDIEKAGWDGGIPRLIALW